MDLVPKDALKQMADFDGQIKKTVGSLSEILDKTVAISKSLSKTGIDFKNLSDIINKWNQNNANVNNTISQQQSILNQQEKVRQRILALQTQEGKELERMRQQLNASQRSLRNQVKEQNAASGSIDGMRGRLNRLNQIWDKMSNTMRDFLS